MRTARAFCDFQWSKQTCCVLRASSCSLVNILELVFAQLWKQSYRIRTFKLLANVLGSLSEFPITLLKTFPASGWSQGQEKICSMPVTCSVSPITFQNQTLEVKKIVEFFEFLVTGKDVQIIVENTNFWSWKKNAKKSHGEWEYSLFCKDKLPKIKLSMHTSKMSSWTCDVNCEDLNEIKGFGIISI